jgi:hypothetical protein
MRKNVWKGVIEVSFITFLLYSNLLIGEFVHSGMAQDRGLAWALIDIFTNLVIAAITGLIGYVLIELLRNRF